MHVLSPHAVSRAPAARWRAASASAVLHGGVLAMLCLVAVPRMPDPPAQSFAIVMLPPPSPAPAAQETLPAADIRPAPPVAPPPLAAPLPLSLPPSLRAELHAARRLPSQRPAPVTPAVAAARPAAPASLQSAPAPVAKDVLAGLEARIRQAVQDAAIYPASARVMRLEGRTQVRFDYTDGAVDAAGIATPSSSPMLDRAALAAVRGAVLPRAPAEIGGRRLPLLVWVEFRLVRQD